MKTQKLSEEAIKKINTWVGFELFDGSDIDFRSKDPEIYENGQGTVLMEAIERAEIDVVKILIQAGANVNAVNIRSQNTPLLHLPKNSRKSLIIADELIKAGANVNCFSKFEDSDHFWSPLIEACSRGNYELVCKLLKAGADPNLSWKEGLTAICMLENDSKNYIKILQELINANADVNAFEGSALRQAIREGNKEAIKLLIHSGARSDVKNTDTFDNGRTAFMCFLNGNAMAFGSSEEEEFFSILFKSVHDFNVLDNDGKNVLFYAADTYIGDDDFPITIFDKILFKNKIDLNHKDNHGNTILNYFLLQIEEEDEADEFSELSDELEYKILSLILAGVDVSIANNYGENAQSVANRIGNTSILYLIENNRSLINAEDSKGRTPLLIACAQGYTEKVEWLIGKGAYVNKKNRCHKSSGGMHLHDTFIPMYENTSKPKNFTSLMAAQNLDTIKLLLRAGAGINEKDSDGYTALMHYAKNSYMEGIKELLDAGADANLKNRWYETALVIAKKNSNDSDFIKFLENNTRKSTLSPFLCYIFCLFKPS